MIYIKIQNIFTKNVLERHICYCCGRKGKKSEFRKVDIEFENLPDREYVDLIDILGLHHCSGESNEFNKTGNPNVCKICFIDAKKEYKEKIQ